MTKPKDSTRISFAGHKLKDILKDLMRVKPPHEGRRDRGNEPTKGNKEPERDQAGDDNL